MKNEIMKEYIFYQAELLCFSVLFNKTRLHFIFCPYFSIWNNDDSDRTYKNSNLPSNGLVKDIFYFNHKPRSMVV